MEWQHAGVLLVIAGAGASYDCLTGDDMTSWNYYRVQGRPPLANELFAPRKKFAEQMPEPLRGLAAHLRSAVNAGTSMEEELESVAKRPDDVAYRELMALRFYLNDVITYCDTEVQLNGRAGTRYDALVRALDTWSRDTSKSIAYATFNYDRCLERAFSANGSPAMNQLTDYVRDSSFRRLYKLHGSIGWVRTGNRIVFRSHQNDKNVAIENASHLELGSVSLPSADRLQGNAVEVPAIAVPTVSKVGFECPDDHLEQLRKDLDEVDAILVAGWRGAEQHFLQELSTHIGGRPVKVLIANGREQDAERECLEHLKGAIEPSTRRCVEPMQRPGGPLGFSDLTTSAAFREFLGAI